MGKQGEFTQPSVRRDGGQAQLPSSKNTLRVGELGASTGMLHHPISLGSLLHSQRTRGCSCGSGREKAAISSRLLEALFPFTALGLFSLPWMCCVLSSQSEQSHTTGFRVNTGYQEAPGAIAKALATQPHLEI